MVILARMSRGLTQKALSESVGVTQGRISKVEAGLLDVSPDLLASLVDVLDYPESFFYQPGAMLGVGVAEVFHRKRANVPQRILDRVYAEIEVRIRHMQALFRAADIPCAIRRLSVEEYKGEVETIAQLVRAGLRLPRGPVQDMVLTLEDAGVAVVPFDFGTQHIDAISRWIPGLPPIFFVNTEVPKDRLRFSLAHELAHVIMHEAPDEDLEKQADRFAAEFLMPAHDIRPALANVTLASLAQLKRYWRVSMAALLKRAQDLRTITSNQARYLWMQMSRFGYRRREPVELDVHGEEPQLIHELIELYRTELDYSLEELRRVLSLHEADFRKIYLVEQPEARISLTMQKNPKVG